MILVHILILQNFDGLSHAGFAALQAVLRVWGQTELHHLFIV